MLSKRIKYARMHLSRRQHTNILAQPNWRRVKNWTINLAPHPFSIARAALRSRASRRIQIMAQPVRVAKKYTPRSIALTSPAGQPRVISKTVSQRILELSLPKKGIVVSNKRKCSITPQQKERLAKILVQIKSSRYQEYRVVCNTVAQRRRTRERRRRKKLFRFLSKPEDWQKHNQILQRLAKPKRKYHLLEDPDKRKVISRRANMEHIQMLAQPVIRKPLDTRDPFSVSSSVLRYQASERIQRLAQPKRKFTQPPIIPGEVSRAALKYVAGPLIERLALPAVRSPGREIDLREDAFTVARSALVYKCSAKIKLLAQPKKMRPAKGKKRGKKKKK